tara:strand:- start:85 stop:432 length:348 start_codon:yes stop_codon:yes gene_type:complete
MNKFEISSIYDSNINLSIKFSYTEINGYYNIIFNYEFPKELKTYNQQKILMKQFGLYDQSTDSYYEGDIIKKNLMTEQLINLMMLNDENLETHSGNINSHCYRLSLIEIIKLLWN